MNGLINQVFPLLNGLDAALADIGIGEALRLALWGTVSGVTAMGLYAGLSNQGAIRSKKREIKTSRAELRGLQNGAFHEVMSASLRQLGQSLALLRMILLPSLVSGLPVILVLSWIAVHYTYLPPVSGSTVLVELRPASGSVRIEPASLVAAIPGKDGHYEVRFENDRDVRFLNDRGMIFAGLPSNPPIATVLRKRWWNLLLGNEAGYLPEDVPLREIRFGFAPLAVIEGVPGWMSTWEFVYLPVLVVTAIVIKIGFRIE